MVYFNKWHCTKTHLCYPPLYNVKLGLSHFSKPSTRTKDMQRALTTVKDLARIGCCSDLTCTSITCYLSWACNAAHEKCGTSKVMVKNDYPSIS